MRGISRQSRAAVDARLSTTRSKRRTSWTVALFATALLLLLAGVAPSPRIGFTPRLWHAAPWTRFAQVEALARDEVLMRMTRDQVRVLLSEPTFICKGGARQPDGPDLSSFAKDDVASTDIWVLSAWETPLTSSFSSILVGYAADGRVTNVESRRYDDGQQWFNVLGAAGVVVMGTRLLFLAIRGRTDRTGTEAQDGGAVNGDA